MCFAPVIEIKPNTFSPQWNFYADIQLIRGRFWLQLWTLKKFSEPCVSLNDGSKEVENGESWTYFAERTSSCRLGVCRACVMCRNLLGYSPCNTACTELESVFNLDSYRLQGEKSLPGAQWRGLGALSPVGSRGRAPVGGLGDEVPPEAEVFLEIYR